MTNKHKFEQIKTLHITILNILSKTNILQITARRTYICMRSVSNYRTDIHVLSSIFGFGICKYNKRSKNLHLHACRLY